MLFMIFAIVARVTMELIRRDIKDREKDDLDVSICGNASEWTVGMAKGAKSGLPMLCRRAEKAQTNEQR